MGVEEEGGGGRVERLRRMSWVKRRKRSEEGGIEIVVSFKRKEKDFE